MAEAKELWWSSIPGPASLVEALGMQLVRGESSVVYVSAPLPWGDEFRLSVKDKVQSHNAEYLVEPCSAEAAGTNPGRYVLDHFSTGRVFCLPSEDPGLIAVSKGFTDGKIFWVEGCTTAGQVNAWTAFANQLNSRKRADKGLVVLILSTDLRTQSALSCLNARDYLTDYDLHFFASSLVSRKKRNLNEKNYLAQLAFYLSFGSPEQCVVIADGDSSVLRSPEKLPSTHTAAEIQHAVWRAQLACVFARIEETKLELVHRYPNELAPLLNTKDEYDNVITALEDIELRHIIYHMGRGKVILPNKAAQTLQTLHKYRNQLAHHHMLSGRDMEKLFDCLGH